MTNVLIKGERLDIETYIGKMPCEQMQEENVHPQAKEKGLE